jgi:uncharacterized protein (DUF2141 family)
MKKYSAALLAASLLTLPLLAEAQLAQLTVTVRGLVPASGKVEVSLFNTPESFLQKPLLQNTQAVDGKEELVFEFSGLLDGQYAVVVVHDENGNDRLDNGFLGLGGESFAYSNDPFTLFGRPSFEAASFAVGTENLAIDIELD